MTQANPRFDEVIARPISGLWLRGHPLVLAWVKAAFKSSTQISARGPHTPRRPSSVTGRLELTAPGGAELERRRAKTDRQPALIFISLGFGELRFVEVELHAVFEGEEA